jgi:hypothetical protein
MKPRKKFRTRPKKTGAKKNQRILSQKKRLVAAGYDEAKLRKMTTREIRDALKVAARRKGPREAAGKKKTAKKPAKKKS